MIDLSQMTYTQRNKLYNLAKDELLAEPQYKYLGVADTINECMNLGVQENLAKKWFKYNKVPVTVFVCSNRSFFLCKGREAQNLINTCVDSLFHFERINDYLDNLCL